VNGDTVSSVSPGIGAFLAFFALAIALWLLMRNMNSRMRRMSYRAEEAQREAEAAAEAKAEAKGKNKGKVKAKGRAGGRAAGGRPAGEGDGPEVTPAAEDDGRGDDDTGGRPTQP
jgi:hypothetical protein